MTSAVLLFIAEQMCGVFVQQKLRKFFVAKVNSQSL